MGTSSDISQCGNFLHISAVIYSAAFTWLGSVYAQIKIMGKNQVSINIMIASVLNMKMYQDQLMIYSQISCISHIAIHFMPNPSKTVGFCGSLLATVYLNLHFTSVPCCHQIHATSVSVCLIYNHLAQVSSAFPHVRICITDFKM